MRNVRQVSPLTRANQLNGAPQQPPHPLPVQWRGGVSLLPQLVPQICDMDVVQACAVICGEAKQLVGAASPGDLSA